MGSNKPNQEILLVRFVKGIGVMAGVVVVLASKTAGDSFAANLFSSYEEMARDDFATPQALNSLCSLYERVESEPVSSGIIKDVEFPWSDHPGYAHTRRIPAKWIQSQFREWGNRGMYADEDDFVFWRDVLAYYNEQNQLQGIEFYGSRYGCFISRKPVMCPPWFLKSKLIAEKPLYVTIRFMSND
jgi:hypothetical protein